MSRHIVHANHGDVEVLAEEFSIVGTEEVFIVHHSLNDDGSSYTATHSTSGFKIGCGNTIDEAIANGTKRWLDAGPEKRAVAMKTALAALKKRDERLDTLARGAA